MSTIRTRFAPSPTGFLHVGSVRTALYNELFAHKHGGVFVLRLEDTDAARNHADFERSILRGFAQLNIVPDEGLLMVDGEIVERGPHAPYRQSQRTDLYVAKLKELAERGAIYPAYETKEELEAMRQEQVRLKQPPRYTNAHRDLTPEQRAAFEAEGRVPAWRFRVDENEVVEFDDLIRGPQRVHAREIGDFIIARSLTEPLYNFVVVIDDIAMEITHIIRAEEHLANTPKQVLLYRALGAPMPQFAHIPLILNPDRSKMSKRSSVTNFDAYMDRGFLPEAIVNYLALIGWNPGDNRELYTRAELTQAFSLERVHKSGGVFDMKKLEWMNAQYLKELQTPALLEKLQPFFSTAKTPVEPADRLERAVEVTRPRYNVLSDGPTAVACYMSTPVFPDAALLWGTQTDQAQAAASIAAAIAALDAHADWTLETLKECLTAVVTALGVGNGPVLWPVRVALTGEAKSPGPVESAWILGKDEAIARLRLAHSVLLKA